MAAALLLSVAASSDLKLVTFDGAKGTTFKFTELNDPVMGGKSTGTWSLSSSGHFGVFDGEVVDVPALKAPGFIKAAADGSFSDLSSTAEGSLVLSVRTKTPSYRGFRITIASGTVAPSYSCAGGGGIPFSRGCFKAKFNVPAGSDFTEVSVPFSAFSDLWSSATGEHTKECADDSSACLTAAKLKGIKRVEVWAEGVAGKVHLEVKAVTARSSAAEVAMLAESSDDTGRRVRLASFDGAKGLTHTWREENDPVMGGASTGTFSIKDNVAVMDGSVNLIPRLQAPGFIQFNTNDNLPFPDVSGCKALSFTARSATNYTGYRVSFGSVSAHSRYGYGFKAPFTAPMGEFGRVTIPFNHFSNYWDPATGKITHSCAENKAYCPDKGTLKNMNPMAFWAEGVKGAVHLEVKSIDAVGCDATVQPLAGEISAVVPIEAAPKMPPKAYDTCTGNVQSELRYNISTRPGGMYSPPNESMAVSVCCDSRMKQLAETQFLFEAPDIALFSHLDASGVTTFYDSVCGIPLFKAPMNRSLAEFKADTQEHGWPSFRPAEVVTENVVTDKKSGFVTSKCGTHLGSFLPDNKGARWCMDLSCISGNPAH